jgi:hypothetical protein
MNDLPLCLQGPFPERTCKGVIACLPVGRGITPYRTQNNQKGKLRSTVGNKCRRYLTRVIGFVEFVEFIGFVGLTQETQVTL